MSIFGFLHAPVRAASFAVTGALVLASASALAQVNGELYVTRFAGSPNVGKFTYSYDGNSFSASSINWFVTTLGADGIIANPQATGHLLVGGQQYSVIHDVDPVNGVTVSYASPTYIYHVVATDPSTVFGNSIPGLLTKFTVHADGTLSAGKVVSLSGDDLYITQVISTPAGFFYNSDHAGAGHGSFGRLVFNANGSAATTSRILTDLPATHGAMYDPYAGNIISFGAEHITQIGLDGVVVSDLSVPSGEWYPLLLDQGTADGKGHAFAASNTGHLVFVDYSKTGKVGDATSFVSVNFLEFYLDDVAPLLGAGSTVGISAGKCNNGFGNGTDCEPPGHIGNSHPAHKQQDELYSSGAAVPKAP